MNTTPCLVASVLACFCLKLSAADPPFDGLNLGLGNLYRVSSAQTRSISPENFTGEKGRGAMSTNGVAARGAAREPGQGWKVSRLRCASPLMPLSRWRTSAARGRSSRYG